MLKAIVESRPYMRFDRALFSGHGDFSLNFQVFYYLLDSDFNFYMGIQQQII